MRFDKNSLQARLDNMAAQPKPRSDRQWDEISAINASLCDQPYVWLTPSKFDPEAERLRNAYPAAGTTRIRWMMDEETITRVTGDMRASDFEIGYTKNDHLFYSYGGKDSDLLVRKPTTHKLKVGGTYKTQEGKSVTIAEARHTPGYECVLGDDGIWRYNREGECERGRVTGTAHDFSDPRNLIPEPSIHEYMLTVDKAIKGMKTGRMSGRGAGMSQMPRHGGKMSDMLKQLPTPEEAKRQVQAWREAYPHARIIDDEIDLTSPPVTLSPEGEAAPMTELPQWVEGLPLMSGYRGERYNKDVVVPAVFDGKVVRYHADAAKIGKGLMWDKARALAYGVDHGLPVEEFQTGGLITRVWTPGDPTPDEARPYMDDRLGRANSIHVNVVPPGEDTLAEEIAADVERAAKLAAQTHPGFVSYEDAKAQGLVDEDPWPTTEEILAAHAAKHYADGMREDAERDLARIEARNAFKKALRKSAITASLVMIGGVAACFAVGLIGALIYTAFNFFLPRMQGSETAATVGGYAVLIMFGLLFGALVGTSTRR